MSIRWRLAVLFAQSAALIAVTFVNTGRGLSAEIWFAAVVAIIVNKQLLEPYFARPVDTFGQFWPRALSGAALTGWTCIRIA